VEGQLVQLDDYEEALLFPSGMSAITSVLFIFRKQGDRIIFTGKGYRHIRRFCYDYLAKLGVEIVALDPANPDAFNG